MTHRLQPSQQPQTRTRTQHTTPATDGSRTITLDPTSPQAEEDGPDTGPSGVLRLRGLPPRDAPRVQWDDEVVDNEGMGKKKSKICCIYHKPKPFDESSSSSSSSSGEDEEADDGGKGGEAGGDSSMHPPTNDKGKRPSKRKKRPKCEDEACSHQPNAYEKPAP